MTVYLGVFDIIYKDVGDIAFSGTHANGYPQQHIYGTTTYLDVPTKADYNFVGWFLNSDGSGPLKTYLSATEYTADITLYAQWGIPDFTYSLINNGTSYAVSKGSITLTGALYIPNTYNGLLVTKIANSGFINCTGITSLIIPSTITEIGTNAFVNCTGLTSISVDSGNSAYYSSGNCLIRTLGNILVLGCKNSVIPSGVTAIGSEAFAYSEINYISIPASVQYIYPEAFAYCEDLVSVTFTNANNSSLQKIYDAAFSNCTALYNIQIPKNVSYIGPYAFYDCSGLVNVTFANSNISLQIMNQAFAFCTGMNSIFIPSRVVYMGSNVFMGWSSSKTIYMLVNYNSTANWNSNWNFLCSAQIIWVGSSPNSEGGEDDDILTLTYEEYALLVGGEQEEEYI